MNTSIQRFRSWLNVPVDGHVLGLFRLYFGLFMVYYSYSYYAMGYIPEGLLKPHVLFKFDYMEWVPLFSAPTMYVMLFLMGVSALLIATGFFFRWACWAFSLLLAFFFFQEKSYYNNHIYLYILVPLLLSATNADRFLSLRSLLQKKPKAKRREKKRSAEMKQAVSAKQGTWVPRWQQFILQAQIVLLYFYAGVVKFKADWLFRMEPATSLVRTFPEEHWMAPLIKHDFNIYLFTYGGFALDILAPLLLWYKPVRNIMWIPFVLFHFTNSQVFDDIGTFPYVMLGTMVLFFYTHEIPGLRRLAPAPSKSTKGEKGVLMPSTVGKWGASLLIAYFVFQLLFPLRCFFLPNPVDYTTIGNRFAWRVKADTRKPEEMRFIVRNPTSGEELPVDIQTFINTMQVKMLAIDPRATRDFARFLKEEVARQGMPNAQVMARIRFGYNGRKPQYFVDPNVDLATVPYSPFKKLDWVMPVQDE